MFSPVACPACKHKISIPEGDMGKRLVCANCQSPFFAGRSVAEAEAAAAPSPPGNPSYARTMLADDAAPAISYSCPRCKVSLEAPLSEAGTKKPCPSCGQRHQVPAAPRPVAAAAPPNLNKTMLADDDARAAPPIKYNCPGCKKPLEAPAAEAGTKKPCPSCGQRHQVPAASAGRPNLNKTMLAGDESKAPLTGVPAGYPAPAGAGGEAPLPTGQLLGGQKLYSPRNLAIGAGILLLLLILVPALVRGGRAVDTAAAEEAKKELARVNAEIEQRKAEVDRQKLLEAKTQQQLDEMAEKIRRQDEKMRDDHRQALRAISDQKLKSEMEDRFEAAQRKWEQDKRDMEKSQRQALEETKARLDESKRALETAQQRQQTIIHQPPPVMYYPFYHPRYYWGW